MTLRRLTLFLSLQLDLLAFGIRRRIRVGARRKADAYAETVIGEIRKWQAKGITTCKDLTDMLTGKIKTRRGAERWPSTQVKRMLEGVSPLAPAFAEGPV